MKYNILQKDKTKYVCLVLLNEIINFQHYFDVVPHGEEIFIEEYLKIMYDRGVLDIENNQYIPTKSWKCSISSHKLSNCQNF